MTTFGALRQWRPGTLARNTALASAWQGVRLVLQFVYLILVARTLGAEGYGIFSGSVALATCLSPLVGCGFGMILVQEVSRDPQRFQEFWGKAMRAIAISSPPMVGIMLGLAALLLPVNGNWIVITLITVAELLVMPLVATSSLAFQAHERLGWTIFNHVQLNFLRLGALIMLASFDRDRLVEVACAYFAATAGAALLSLAQVRKAFGANNWAKVDLSDRIREGLGFSFGVVASTAHNDFDKTLLLSFSNAEMAGTYSVANRVMSAASIPLLTYVMALAPRLFRFGESGIGSGMRAARGLFPPVVVYGVLAGVGMYVFAGILPILFGTEFQGSVSLLKSLALLPILIGLSTMLLGILTCSGEQWLRIPLELVAVSLNVTINLALIPKLGAFGTVLALIASQFALVTMAGIAIYLRASRERLT